MAWAILSKLIVQNGTFFVLRWWAAIHIYIQTERDRKSEWEENKRIINHKKIIINLPIQLTFWLWFCFSHVLLLLLLQRNQYAYFPHKWLITRRASASHWHIPSQQMRAQFSQTCNISRFTAHESRWNSYRIIAVLCWYCCVFFFISYSYFVGLIHMHNKHRQIQRERKRKKKYFDDCALYSCCSVRSYAYRSGDTHNILCTRFDDERKQKRETFVYKYMIWFFFIIVVSRTDARSTHGTARRDDDVRVADTVSHLSIANLLNWIRMAFEWKQKAKNNTNNNEWNEHKFAHIAIDDGFSYIYILFFSVAIFIYRRGKNIYKTREFVGGNNSLLPADECNKAQHSYHILVWSRIQTIHPAVAQRLIVVHKMFRRMAYAWKSILDEWEGDFVGAGAHINMPMCL